MSSFSFHIQNSYIELSLMSIINEVCQDIKALPFVFFLFCLLVVHLCCCCHSTSWKPFPPHKLPVSCGQISGTPPLPPKTRKSFPYSSIFCSAGFFWKSNEGQVSIVVLQNRPRVRTAYVPNQSMLFVRPPPQTHIPMFSSTQQRYSKPTKLILLIIKLILWDL